MSRNGSGVYTPPSSSWNPPVSGATMSSDDFIALLEDISEALTLSIALDGQTTTSNRIPFSAGISVLLGSAGAPAVSFIGDATSGLFSPGAGQVGLAAGGVACITSTSTATNLPLPTTFAQKLTAAADAQIGGAGSTVGFYGAVGSVKRTVTGSRGGNAALASLITALAATGLITDSTTA